MSPSLEMAMTYRRVFGSPDGRLVLKDLLGDLYHFSQTTNPEEVALRNFSMRLLDKIGAFTFDSPETANDELEIALVDNYLTKPTLHVGEE